MPLVFSPARIFDAITLTLKKKIETTSRDTRSRVSFIEPSCYSLTVSLTIVSQLLLASRDAIRDVGRQYCGHLTPAVTAPKSARNTFFAAAAACALAHKDMLRRHLQNAAWVV
jgi:hypothetical protein